MSRTDKLKIGGQKHRRAWADLLIICALSIFVFIAACVSEVFEKFAGWVEKHDELRVDDAVPVFVFLSIAFGIFAWRRWRELHTEIFLRLRAEADLLEANAELEARVKERTTELSMSNEQLHHELVERQQAETALRESEERYRQIVESANDIIYKADARGHFTFCNPTASRIMKYAESELIGLRFIELIRPDYRKAVAHFYRQQFSNRVPSTYYEFPVIAKDGAEVWMGQNVQMLEADEHGPGFQAVARDITERKRAEDAMRQAEEYHNLFKLANDPIIIFEPEGEIVIDVNDRACETYGLKREEFIGRSLIDFSLNAERGKQHIEMLMIEGRCQEFSTVQMRADGTPIHLIVNSSVIEYHGHPAILSINRDVTERKRAEDERQHLEEQLRQSQKMESIGTLAGGVAHDFNNLLTAITGYSDLSLRRLNAADPVRHNIQEIRKAADRSAALTRQLLAFSRRQRLESKVINLNDLIGEQMKMLRRIIGEDVEVRLHAAPKLSFVLADPGQIEQVVMNLAINARDAMPGGGQLTIETSNVELDETFIRSHAYMRRGKYVLVMVSDTGTGMKAETRERVFEPFFTTKEFGKGTGLGLSTAYGIVKQHNGFIDVYSEVGQGTTFKIYLPITGKPQDDEYAETLPPIRGGTQTILVAEDEEALRELARGVLEDLGYKVVLARDGEEAVELYSSEGEKIDLLLLDMVMPRMGGYKAYERISALRPSVPVIFMTGYSVEAMQSRFANQNEALEETGALIIQKPYSLDTLVRKVYEVLDGAAVASS
jgi:two-component system, cell cycle sensor histidine kinase and response regulator CckA